ncbi:MAG: RidA family protein [Pseudomonadota bacterium]
MGEIESRLEKLGISLPEAAAPAANYVPFKMSGNMLFTSGQLPLLDGKLMHTGIIGDALSVEQGAEAARQCAVNVLSVAKLALGELTRIQQIVKITIFVASTRDFTHQHVVGNGASDLLVAALEDKGRHARSAVGMPSLPLNAPVEVEAIIEFS